MYKPQHKKKLQISYMQLRLFTRVACIILLSGYQGVGGTGGELMNWIVALSSEYKNMVILEWPRTTIIF